MVDQSGPVIVNRTKHIDRSPASRSDVEERGKIAGPHFDRREVFETAPPRDAPGPLDLGIDTFRLVWVAKDEFLGVRDAHCIVNLQGLVHRSPDFEAPGFGPIFVEDTGGKPGFRGGKIHPDRVSRVNVAGMVHDSHLILPSKIFSGRCAIRAALTTGARACAQ